MNTAPRGAAVDREKYRGDDGDRDLRGLVSNVERRGPRDGPVNGTILGEDGLARPAWVAVDPLLRAYYNTEWEMPVTDERGVDEHLTLEGFQAGLSWATILRKCPAFRAAFPDLNFWGTAVLIAENDYVVGQWEGGGTHTGAAFDELPIGSLPAGSGKTMRFSTTGDGAAATGHHPPAQPSNPGT